MLNKLLSRKGGDGLARTEYETHAVVTSVLAQSLEAMSQSFFIYGDPSSSRKRLASDYTRKHKIVV